MITCYYVVELETSIGEGTLYKQGVVVVPYQSLGQVTWITKGTVCT